MEHPVPKTLNTSVEISYCSGGGRGSSITACKCLKFLSAAYWALGVFLVSVGIKLPCTLYFPNVDIQLARHDAIYQGSLLRVDQKHFFEISGHLEVV